MPAAKRRYWLMKSEPDEFAITDLERLGQAPWDGVRNHQARNFMRDEMRVGDLVLFYHSSTKPPGVAGVARIAKTGLPDPSAWDKASPYYDPKSDPNAPRWWMVEVEFVEAFAALVSLDTLRADAALDGMLVTRRGQRLSVQPVDKPHFARVLRLAKAKLRIR